MISHIAEITESKDCIPKEVCLKRYCTSQHVEQGDMALGLGPVEVMWGPWEVAQPSFSSKRNSSGEKGKQPRLGLEQRQEGISVVE